MPRIDHNTLLRFGSAVLEAVGTQPPTARIVAQHLVDSNLAGHDSHGVMRLPQYCEHARDGKVDPTAEPVVVSERGSTALVDGRSAWGPVAAGFATNVAIEKAKVNGVAAVAVRGAHHVGRVGVYPARAAAEGLVGIAFCNVRGVARVAPWGSVDRLLTTNPIAIAVPSKHGTIITDFATSAVAEGKVRLAKTAGKRVPHGWVIDADGKFSDDPNVAYEDGAIAPLGGDQGHKGYALCVAIDLLGGVLPAAGCALLAEGYGNGLLLNVVDPAAFGDRAEFDERVDAYRAYLKRAQTSPEVEEVLLPGDVERARERDRRARGIEIAPEVWNELRSLGRELNVELA